MRREFALFELRIERLGIRLLRAAAEYNLKRTTPTRLQCNLAARLLGLLLQCSLHFLRLGVVASRRAILDRNDVLGVDVDGLGLVRLEDAGF